MNHVYLNDLFDCYASLLTDKERDYFKNYYQFDLSLKEIAEENNVSRAAVSKSLKITEEKLLNYEEKLKLMKIGKCLSDIYQEKDLTVIKTKIKNILDDKI